MRVANAIAEILKLEGVKFIIGYPVNSIIEAAAEADIRTVIVRQERETPVEQVLGTDRGKQVAAREDS